jgi:hypothetical protein
MPVIKLEQFGGQIPMLDARLLPPQNSVYCENAFLQPGRLEPLAADIPIHTLADPNARYAFRIPISSPSIDNMLDSYWLEFDVVSTFVVRSPITDEANGGSFYFANGQMTPGYTTKNRIANGGPISPPVLSSLVGSTTGGMLPAATQYFYVVTAVNGNGETLKSNELSTTTGTGATNSVTVNWAAVTGAIGYKVYRGTTAGTENVHYSPVGTSTTFIDTGAASTAGAPPVNESTNPNLILGIPRPEVAPTVVPTDTTTAPTESRAYVYTWVSADGEEGQPSPPTIALGSASAGIWNLTMTPPTVTDTANRTLTTLRIYRTETGTDGTVAFFFVAELPITTTTFADNIPSTTVVNSGILASEDWAAPPTDLVGLVSMPNGMVAGWRNNEVWFCEPYRPHAWPVKYMVGVESPVVGLGTIDQNLMILTDGQPYVATGVHPSVMALRKVQPLEPCTSSGSIVSSPNGVLYTSNNGLIMIGPAGGQNLTFNTIRKDEWSQLLNLRTVRASFFMNGYYAYSSAIDGVFQDDTFEVADAFQVPDYTGTLVGAYIAGDPHLGFMTLTCDTPTYNVLTDLWTGETMVIRNGQVFHVDRRQHNPRQSYRWQSKIFQLKFKDNLAAAKIFYDLPPGLPITGSQLFKLYTDEKLRYTRAIPPSGQQFRLPSGYKADFAQIELSGQLMIYNVQVATSARELREV